MRVEYRPAMEADIPVIAADAREADVVEMAALGYGFGEALCRSLERSDFALTATVNDVPVCMLGVAPVSVIFGEGAPWLLSSNGALRAQKSLLKTCRPVVAEMLRRYPRLLNIVDSENAVSIRWLRWVGFEFLDQHFPIRGRTFRLFRLGDWS